MRDLSSKLKTTAVVVIALAILGLGLSLFLIRTQTLHDAGLLVGKSFCDFSAHLSCIGVMDTKWSKIFGVSLATYGAVFYLALILLAFAVLRRQVLSADTYANIMLVLSASAVLFSIYLFFISHYVIKILCPFCLGMYFVNIGLLIASVWYSGTNGIATRISAGSLSLVQHPRLFKMLFTASERSMALLYLRGVLLCLVLAVGAPIFFLKTFPKPPPDPSLSLPWPRGTRAPIDLNLSGGVNVDYARGPEGAPIEMIEFLDFECPFCRQFSIVVDDLLREYEGKIFFVFKNFPLDNSCNPAVGEQFHKHSCYAALYSRCAGEQGKFWEVSKHLLTLEALDLEAADPDPRKAVDETADELGLDKDAITECMQSNRHVAKIHQDIADGEKLQLQGTPSIWINGRPVPSVKEEDLRRIFDDILKDQKGGENLLKKRLHWGVE